MSNGFKQSTAITGVVDIGPGQTWAYICWVFVITVIGITSFLMLANFSRREQVAGFLSADPQIMRINAPHVGRVQKIIVKEGQSVSRGDVLMYIDPDPILVNGKATAQSELERIKISEQEIQKRIQSTTMQVDMKIDELSNRITAIRSQIDALHEGIALQRQTTALLQKQLLSGQALLKSGAISSNELEKRDASLYDGKISIQNLMFSLHENEANLAQLIGQKSQTPVEGDLKISDLRQAIVELDQRRTEAQGRLAFQITAPTDGTVDAIMIASGQAVETSSDLISILPKASVLIGELYVPSKAIVFLEPSQPVRIAYNAFPYVRYGFADGKILSVSETILRPEEIQKPISVSEPSYRVTVSLESQIMKAGEREIRLRPGLTLSADIILDRQSLAQWIMQSVRELWSRV